MNLQQWIQQSLRPSRTASTPKLLLQTLLQIVMFWSFFLGLLPLLIVAAEDAWSIPHFRTLLPHWTGWIVFCLAGTLGLSSAMCMVFVGRGTPLPLACAPRLVVRGPYRWVRNPMAVAGLTQGAAVGWIYGSWSTLAYVTAGALVWNFGARPVEEADLEQRFGESYRHYKRHVRCWIPRLRAWPTPIQD